MEELISVIIPVYNTDPIALDCCFSCIQNQTYDNLEIICVDGGSNDSTLIVLQKYLLDKRFKLINTSPGVSHQRNVGICNSIGKYIIFIDSDDFFNKYFISSLYSSLKSSNVDVAIPLIHRCEFVDNALIKDVPYDVIQIEEKVNKDNYFKYCRTGELVNPIKLYKAQLLNGVMFPEKCSYGEDLLFNYELSKKTFSTIFVPNAIYNYRVIIANNNTARRLDKKGLYIVKELAKIIKSNEIKSHESIEGLYKDFDFVFKEFYYSLARKKRIGDLIWMIRYKPLYLRNHHNFHDILFLLFPIIIVSRRNKKEKKRI